jgi:hypothetical protein
MSAHSKIFRLVRTLACTLPPNKSVTHVVRTCVTYVVRTPNIAPYLSRPERINLLKTGS